ncbi:hypothetical protein ISP15_10550 [Dyella jejuensis]|uniref:Uncharacterized protein n=1 Tax=Dyella jejuensis TaxID=1432009 RepID=A0ABW8JKG8_9GAMM
MATLLRDMNLVDGDRWLSANACAVYLGVIAQSDHPLSAASQDVWHTNF